jgi:hypothetical protein
MRAGAFEEFDMEIICALGAGVRHGLVHTESVHDLYKPEFFTCKLSASLVVVFASLGPP